ncbi:type II toxin-antitoxin system ParD family antitoxin [Methylobacterium sp. J-076]|uniref:ribbon-helix-helix domain-containing protein n=1 Tax=Methylobacterium sp. J-076 TaxID=2836655 RepID=UPI001FB9A1D7|nr:type II toxin-antitoxin system ParD family antitoxin [Methylobacterium sp. J-076]MCJ2011598.1 type II toxin-antitoxin system ParD family antitoxin [Methylobacterium sp. J-076]
MPRGETISVTMAPETLRAVRERVEAGEYASVDAALDDAVRALQRQRREEAEDLDAIRARIRRSLDDPRPDLSSAEVQDELDMMFAEAEHEFRRA